jgi:non-ribosomal peptide synthetase component F
VTGYRVVLQVFDEAGAHERQRAEQRFCRALESALGDADLVAPVYRQYQRLIQTYGEDPDPLALSDAERELLQAWQSAEAAALSAALGPQRYMGDAQFEIYLEPGPSR